MTHIRWLLPVAKKLCSVCFETQTETPEKQIDFSPTFQRGFLNPRKNTNVILRLRKAKWFVSSFLENLRIPNWSYFLPLHGKQWDLIIFDPDLSRLYETSIEHRITYNTDLIDVKTLIEINTWIISVGYGPVFESNCFANFCQGRSSVLPEFVRKFVTLAWRCHGGKYWLRPVIKRLIIFSVTPAPYSIPHLVRLRIRSDKGWKRKLSHSSLGKIGEA